MEGSTTLTTLQKQELANALTHGLGLLFGLVGIAALVSQASIHHSVPVVASTAVFGFGFLMVFAASTIYHCISNPALKQRLRILDHISIYFQIVGSYTPFIVLYAFEGVGLWLLAILWGLTILGIFFKLYFTHRFEWLSVSIYLLMGWSIVILPSEFFDQISGPVLWLIVAGGLSYTVGIAFYLWKKLTYHHAIWHLWVLAGSLCHYFAVFVAIRPPS